MAIVRSFTVGNGDMFYIKHNSDNFTIIDCQLFGDHKDWLMDELKRESKGKGVTRFVSTHPDEDHIEGIEHLDAIMPITNFYVVRNNATKNEDTNSFKHYCKLRDSKKAYYVRKDCKRKWMNISDGERGASGIDIHWPDTSNSNFKAALADAADGAAFNNISLVMRYNVQNSASFMWVGDLETDFMTSIYSDVSLPKTTVVFAPHHGRVSGKLPDQWLQKLRPKIIVIGEAPARDLHYYTGYKTITQNHAGDITFVAERGRVHCYASRKAYGKRDWLDDQGLPDRSGYELYIGTLTL